MTGMFVWSDALVLACGVHKVTPFNGQPLFLLSDGSSQPLAVFLLAALVAVGGFLFGYDTGVISGAMAVIIEEDAGY